MKNERCTNMKNQVIAEITRQMLPYLGFRDLDLELAVEKVGTV